MVYVCVTLMLFLFSVVGLMLSSLFLCPGWWGNVFPYLFQVADA